METLPPELLCWIFSYLNPQTLLTASLVSREWHKVQLSESLWRSLCTQLSSGINTRDDPPHDCFGSSCRQHYLSMQKRIPVVLVTVSKEEGTNGYLSYKEGGRNLTLKRRYNSQFDTIEQACAAYHVFLDTEKVHYSWDQAVVNAVIARSDFFNTIEEREAATKQYFALQRGEDTIPTLPSPRMRYLDYDRFDAVHSAPPRRTPSEEAMQAFTEQIYRKHIERSVRNVVLHQDCTIMTYGEAMTLKDILLWKENCQKGEGGIFYHSIRTLLEDPIVVKGGRTLKMNFLVLYNEKIEDMLLSDEVKEEQRNQRKKKEMDKDKEKKTSSLSYYSGLVIRERSPHPSYRAHTITYLPDCIWKEFNTIEQAMALLDMGINNRLRLCTHMSALSSRMTNIVQIMVVPSEKANEEKEKEKETPSSSSQQQPSQETEEKGLQQQQQPLIDNTSSSSTIITSDESHIDTIGILTLVEWAAHWPRTTTTTSSRYSVREGSSIMKSLTSLGLVINSLSSSNARHIPYRDSKGTRILCDSIGGRAKPIWIFTLNDKEENNESNLYLLRLANRVTYIVGRK